MKCPTCEAAGMESRVIEHAKRVLVPDNGKAFFDEAGEYHNHNMCSALTPFECSRGHGWEHRSAVRCPTCGVPVDPSGSDKFGRVI